MVIAPNSTILLFSGMPLDKNYNDTLFFASLADQTAFFTVSNAYLKTTLSRNTYQRVNSGVFQASVLADTIYDVNYMAFQNTNFGNKWFYAFVDSVEYINDGNTEIRYTIDIMQSYFFDVELKQCIIKRQHPHVDNIGGNIEPEPISLQEYTYEHYGFIGSNTTELDVCVMWVDNNASAVSGHMIAHNFSGANVNAFDTTTTGIDNLKNFIATTASGNLQRADGVLAIYISPHWVTNGNHDTNGRSLSGATTYQEITLPLWNDYESKVNNYTIRNKKLLTYPYSFLQLTTGEGKTLPLRYEFFDGAPKVALYASPVPPIQLTVAPKNYKGNSLNNYPVCSESMTSNVYPLCSWSYDTFRAWLAQNTVPALIQAGGSVLQGAMTGGGMGAASAAKGLVSQATQFASGAYTASIAADTSRGDFSGTCASYAAGLWGITLCRIAQNRRALADIDDFFDLFGYAQNQKGVPSRNARPHWTYVQTENCAAVGECPADDLENIKAIYDRGVRFWKTASEIGNFSLDNSPVVTP